jgi:hypothetical protein
MIWSLISKLLYRTKVKPFIKAIQDPIAAQEKRLDELLQRAANTVYGKRYHFDKIRNYEEFVECVPANQYHDLYPYIQQELEGIPNVLYPDPIMAVMATSGTTGEPKLIPYTTFSWKSSNRFQLLYFASADKIRPFLHGKLLAIMAPAFYKRINNWDVGYLTGYGMKNCNKFLASKICPKTWVFDISDWEEKFRETIRQAVENPNITACIGLTSFVMALLRRTKYESYAWLKDDPQLSLKAKRRLKAALTDEDIIDLEVLWPKMSVVFSSGVVKSLYTPVIRELVGDVHIHEAYAGTEATHAVQIYEDIQGTVPVVDDIFFEFTTARDGKIPPDADTIPLSDVKRNTPYRILVTTPSGLWRYDLHDIVIFTDLDPPTLQCLGKSENTINLSGEKVTEGDISSALTQTSEEEGLVIREFVVAPEVTAEGGTYHIFSEFSEPPKDLDRFATKFDHHLQQINELYYHVRAARTITPSMVHAVPPGTFDTFERKRLQERSKAIGQTKMPRITTYEQALEYLQPLIAPVIS